MALSSRQSPPNYIIIIGTKWVPKIYGMCGGNSAHIIDV